MRLMRSCCSSSAAFSCTHAGRKLVLEIQGVVHDETHFESRLRIMRLDLFALTCGAATIVDFHGSESCVTVSTAGTRL